MKGSVFRCVWFAKGYVQLIHSEDASQVYRCLRFGFLKQADKIEKLEKEHGWHEEEFDFILQFMRTLLLKRACC